jgi:hypothetical protein
MTAALRLGLALLAVLALVFAQPAGAQGAWRYFPETGFWVGNEFLAFFDQRGGLDLFGYPIQNVGAENGITVQYFQRARMELHPGQPAAYRVQLGLVGMELRQVVDPAVPQRLLPAAGDRTRQYFPETGQVVGGSFLEFFRARGGLDIFGYPISGEATEGGVTVQYFQRARMEWRPDNALKYRVQLGLVGQELYAVRYGDGAPPPAALTPTPGLATPSAVTAPPKAGVTVTPGAVAAAESTPAPGPDATSSVALTASHLIMFLVTFVAVVLAGVTWLWRRGALAQWLNRRSGPGGPQRGANGGWRSG